MFRILITLGSLILEVATALTEGALAVSMLAAGLIVTMLHVTCDSSLFQRIVNRLTAMDMPDALEPISMQSNEETKQQ
ncbi:hypothetical protein SH661x_003020 [Planctomicrobium sp. SH661]|uniref:hypothetical protein n=1 Tax=Planctomicrobium sp. SH661 TaxID=3448124 RepID=UPI003F5C70F7